jgi:hypothetical protein
MKSLIAVLVLIASCGVAAADPWPLNVSYSADLLVGRDHLRHGHMWRTPQAYRQEIGERQPAVVLRFDRNLAWLVVNGGFVVEVDFARTGMALASILSGRDLNPISDGQDLVDGVETTRYRVHFNHDPVAHFAGLVWVSKPGVVMRIAGEGAFGGREGRVDVEARNVKLGHQPESLFDEPQATARMKVDAMSAAQILQGLTSEH